MRKCLLEIGLVFHQSQQPYLRCRRMAQTWRVILTCYRDPLIFNWPEITPVTTLTSQGCEKRNLFCIMGKIKDTVSTTDPALPSLGFDHLYLGSSHSQRSKFYSIALFLQDPLLCPSLAQPSAFCITLELYLSAFTPSVHLSSSCQSNPVPTEHFCPTTLEFP